MTKRKQNKGVPPTAADFDYTVTELPFCCGVRVVGDMSYDDYGTDDDEINWSTIPAAMAAAVRKGFNYYNKTLIATTVLKYEGSRNGQNEVNKVLSRTGWKKVKDFVNKGTGNTLRMWIFTPTAKR